VDTGSGDGHLLMHIYDHVKRNTPRGKRPNEFQLIMVGVDFNEESHTATAVNLKKQNIPFKVAFGDIGFPLKIMETLKKRGSSRPKLCMCAHIWTTIGLASPPTPLSHIR